MISIKEFTFNPFQENTYVLSHHDGQCIIIDPGCSNSAEEQLLEQYIAEHELDVAMLLNTHCHIDHVLGNAFVKRRYKVPLYIHEKDVPTLKMNDVVAPMYGFPAFENTTADRFLREGDRIAVGADDLIVIFVPGHAPGHIALVNKAQKFCIGGDVLFKDSIGRTDLPGGDFHTLINSIQQQVFALADDVVVHPGHGPETTVGYEKKYNPFCGLASK